MIADDTTTVSLPGGFLIDGLLHRESVIRPIGGADEIFLAGESRSLLPAQRATALLSRCVLQFGPLAPVTAEMIRGLTVGDREALLLHLHRLTFGNGIEAVIACPSPNCAEKLDLALRVDELLLPPYPDARRWYERDFDDGMSYRVRFRLPTGGDQESVAGLGLEDVPGAAEALLRRCIDWISPESDPSIRLDDLPGSVAAQLPEAMAELDPQAELRLHLTCPTCGQLFLVVFDTISFLFQEIAPERSDLYREVHLLAFYYHWSERELMAMTSRKRRRYLELLAEQLRGA